MLKKYIFEKSRTNDKRLNNISPNLKYANFRSYQHQNQWSYADVVWFCGNVYLGSVAAGCCPMLFFPLLQLFLHKSWALLRLYCQFRSQVAVLWSDGVDFAVGEVDGEGTKWHKASPSAVSLFICLNVVLVVAVSAQSALTWQTYWVCGSGSHVEWCWLFIFCLMHLSHPLNLRGDASKSYHLVFLLKGLRGNRTACIEWRDFVGNWDRTYHWQSSFLRALKHQNWPVI